MGASEKEEDRLVRRTERGALPDERGDSMRMQGNFYMC